MWPVSFPAAQPDLGGARQTDYADLIAEERCAATDPGSTSA
jgi:hypothetical protein